MRRNFSQTDKKGRTVHPERQLILGLGTGRCGLRSLSALMNLQPNTSVTFEEPPWLDWAHADDPKRLLARIDRISRTRQQRIVGDVASVYLPYVETLLHRFDGLKLICLKRNKAATVASFSRWLDHAFPLRTDHWCEELSHGTYRDPVRSRLYPKYNLSDRTQCIERYWDEYYQRADELNAKYPDRFCIMDMEQAFNTKPGQRELLSYCGIQHDDQVLVPSIHEESGRSLSLRPGPAHGAKHVLGPRRCVVLVPFTGSIVPGCEASLRELERRGFVVRRVSGYAAIDQGRNQMATDALRDGFEETMWIDADVVFDPDAVEQLRGHQLPICCGVYAQKGTRAIACHILPGTDRMVFGEKGGLQEILYAATGFLHVRRSVYQQVQEKLKLPVCNERFGRPTIPFFAPMILPENEGHWYLAEDFAFSQRVRDCGHSIFADTSLRLWHVGNYAYGWEDAGTSPQRRDDFTLSFQ